MNAPGKNADTSTSSADAAGEVKPPPRNPPNLKGPTIFVYVVSILAGLAAGGIVTIIFRNGGTGFFFQYIARYTSLWAGALGGVLAAWFWVRRMINYVYNHYSFRRFALGGILWGLFAGWIAAMIFWLITGSLLFVFANKHFAVMVPLYAIVGIIIFGTLGGLGVGVICGTVWAIWARPKT